MNRTIHVSHPALLKITNILSGTEEIIFDGLSSLAEGYLESDVIFPLDCPATIRVIILTGQSYTYTIREQPMPLPPIVECLDDIGDVNVPSPTDGYVLYWDAAEAKWQCRALIDADIPAGIARDSEVSGAISDHTSVPAAHHARYTDAEAKAAAVVPGAITDGETKAPTHDAVYDVKVTAEAAQTAAQVAQLISNHAGVKDAHFSNVITLTFIIDGSGSAITTGQKGHLEIPFACTLTAWELLADVAGAIVIDIWKDTYANFPPTNTDAMPGAGKEPTIAATNQKAQDTDISDWAALAIAAGDILAFNVDSCTTITRAVLSLKATKT